MSQNDRRGARGQRRSEDNSHVDAADSVLRTDGGDMRSGHMVTNVDEQACEMFAVGETDERVQGAGSRPWVGQTFFGKP